LCKNKRGLSCRAVRLMRNLTKARAIFYEAHPVRRYPHIASHRYSRRAVLSHTQRERRGDIRASARLELRIAFDINAKAGRMKEKPNESESDRKHEKFRCR
jgi:hypothetical protein